VLARLVLAMKTSSTGSVTVDLDNFER